MTQHSKETMDQAQKDMFNLRQNKQTYPFAKNKPSGNIHKILGLDVANGGGQ